MFKKPLLTALVILFSIALMMGQNRLGTTFKNYQVLSIDSKLENQKSQAGFFETTISVPNQGIEWTLDLHNSNILPDNFHTTYVTDTGIQVKEGTSAVPTKGYIKGDPESRVSLTFNEGFVYGFIRSGGKNYYIEPMSYYNKAAKFDEFVFYSEDDLLPTAERTCATETKDRAHEGHDHAKETVERGAGECFELEYGIANDFSMFQEYGSSVVGVENHAIGVTNNVQTDYDDAFADEIQYIIIEHFVVTVSGGDPWSNTDDAGDLLDEFRAWGNGGGFGPDFDVASLWTQRDIVFQGNSSTIGLASVGVICTSFRYNLLEDFTSTAWAKRVLVSHEIGHNFDAFHDGGNGFIMSPSVNNTATWSNTSINDINNHIASRSCLDNCAGGGVNPPEADFTIDVLDNCVIGQVQFNDNSVGNVTDYNWSFPGGTPSSSTDENPFVEYFNAGTYDVTLTVSNGGGSDEFTINNAVEIKDVADANFFFNVDEFTVEFNNVTTNADSYLWDFGDSNGSSEINPIHTYDLDGDYQVTLTAFSECGPSSISFIVTIVTVPAPNFTEGSTVGCEGHTVQFSNLSSMNSENFNWVFEGGTPEISTEENPFITYNTAGIFDVSLTVSNAAGGETLLKDDLVVISPSPLAGFDYTIDGTSVIFVNSSLNADSYTWFFGDGNSSNDENPTHTYVGDGNYTVTLVASSAGCEDSDSEQIITISSAPTASFSVLSGITAGCAPLSLQFVSQSSVTPDDYLWTFEGGDPATSTSASPTVLFPSAGSYDVSLTVSNANGSDTQTKSDYIFVLSNPVVAPTFTNTELTYNFSANAENADEVTWDFGDGDTGNGLNPTHTYAQDGEYQASVMVSNSCGTLTANISISAYSAVSADFSAVTTLLCKGGQVQFENESSANANSYMWTFAGGTPATSTDASPLVTYNNPGTYDVSLLVSNPSFDDNEVKMQLITVQDDLAPTFSSVESGLTVNFTDETVGEYTTSWDFGDGTMSTLTNPSHTFLSENIYIVTLTTTNECGTYTTENEINLFSDVTAGISASTNTGCAPLEIAFDDASSVNTTDWLWTFAGGTPTSSTAQNPSVLYETAGTYEVTLTASNPASSETTTIMVEVLDIVDVSFEVLRDQLNVSFNNTTAGGNTFAWNFGDGNTSMEENPSHTYAADGEYQVTLTVTNECGESTETTTVAANAQPSAAFGVSGLSEGCAPFEVAFADMSSSNVTGWSWTFEGGTPAASTDQNPVVVFENAGTYDVSLTVSASAGTDTESKADYITVGEEPSGTFTIDVNDNEADFSYTGDEDVQLSWSFGDGKSSSEVNPTNTYEASGVYKVQLTITNECGTLTIEDEVVIVLSAVEDIIFGNINMYPNPATDYIIVDMDKLTEVQVQILDITGKVILSKQIKDGQRISTIGLSEGTYVVRFSADSNTKQYKKLAIFR